MSTEILDAVKGRYSEAAVTPTPELCCPAGYDMKDLLEFIPEEVLGVSYGCGTPVGLDNVQPGETVLDIGSGGGIDCFVASKRVGERGRVIGIDMTDEMLELARRNAPKVAANLGYAKSNVEFRKGVAEKMPVEDGEVDLVVSNCVINLSPDKGKVFREMYRILKSGGRFTISDIVADQPVPNYLIFDRRKWGDCLSGALQVKDYLGAIKQAGFRGIHLRKSNPWKRIDGISFYSVTLSAYKWDTPPEANGHLFATFKGPFSEVVDEFGNRFVRGEPVAIDDETHRLLTSDGFREHFLVAEEPVTLDETSREFRRVLPTPGPCVWEGDYAILTGCFEKARDDDSHEYERGQPLEICSKTLAVLTSDEYAPFLSTINRASGQVLGEAVDCGPGCCD